MHTLEACLSGCPCVDAFAQRSEWILSEYDKLDASRSQATLQLHEAQEAVASQHDTIALLRTMNGILSSRVGKAIKQLAQERRVNSSLRREITRNEDTLLTLKSQIVPQGKADIPSHVPTYI